MSAYDIFLTIFGILAIVPVAILFFESKKNVGLNKSVLIIAALVGFIGLSFMSLQVFGIWIVLIFPFALFAGLALFKRLKKNDGTPPR